jgi:putative toxin-antitoxin system antitoxin component (TIGR02293 family)
MSSNVELIAPEWAYAAELLGGRKILRAVVDSPLVAHRMIKRGIPGAALASMMSQIKVLPEAQVLEAVGISYRTKVRRRSDPKKPLSPEQSGRAWSFAKLLARATEVLGTQDAAEHWLSRPALALDGQRPIELLSTPAGMQMVEQLLGRIEHGVYT